MSEIRHSRCPGTGPTHGLMFLMGGRCALLPYPLNPTRPCVANTARPLRPHCSNATRPPAPRTPRNLLSEPVAAPSDTMLTRRSKSTTRSV